MIRADHRYDRKGPLYGMHTLLHYWLSSFSDRKWLFRLNFAACKSRFHAADYLYERKFMRESGNQLSFVTVFRSIE